MFPTPDGAAVDELVCTAPDTTADEDELTYAVPNGTADDDELMHTATSDETTLLLPATMSSLWTKFC